MNKNNLLIMFEGDDKEGRNKLLEAFTKHYGDDYFAFDTNMFRNLTVATQSNNEYKAYYVKKMMKLYRKNFDIIVVYVNRRKVNPDDPYYQYALEVSHNDERIACETMEELQKYDVHNLAYFCGIKSFRKCEIIFYPVDFEGNVDFNSMAITLKQEIEKIINKKGK